MIEVFAIGAGFNMTFILQDIIVTDPKLKSVSLELNFSASQFTILFAPIVSTMKEPIPTIYLWLYGILNIIFALNINLTPKQDLPLEKTLLSIISGDNTLLPFGNFSMEVS